MNGMTRDTLNELIDRKILWVFGILTLIAVTFVILGDMGVQNVKVQTGGAIDPADESTGLVTTMTPRALDGFLNFVLMIAVFGTAGLIPRMLEKGRAEYYLAQPVSRSGLLLGKLLAIWIVYGGLMVFTGLIMLGTIAAVFGTPSAGVLFVFIEKLFVYFVWLSITAVIGVTTGSVAFTIITQFAIWIAQGLLIQRQPFFEFVNSDTVEFIGNFLYYVLPKFSEVSDIAIAVASDTEVATWLPVWSTALFGLGMIFLAVIFFRRRDY